MPEPRPDTTDFITWLIALAGMIVAYRFGLHTEREAHKLAVQRDGGNRIQAAKDRFSTVIADQMSRFKTGQPRDENGDILTEDRCLDRSVPVITKAIHDLHSYIPDQSIASLEVTLEEYKAYTKERTSTKTRMETAKGNGKPERHTEFLKRLEDIVTNAKVIS